MVSVTSTVSVTSAVSLTSVVSVKSAVSLTSAVVLMCEVGQVADQALFLVIHRLSSVHRMTPAVAGHLWP